MLRNFNKTKKKVTAAVLTGAMVATSFGTGNIAMAAKNNTGSNGKNIPCITGSAISWDGNLPADVVVNWRPEKDIVTGGAMKEAFLWQDVTTITGGSIGWNDIISWWIENGSEKDGNNTINKEKDTVSGGAIINRPEKNENRGEASDKKVVTGGAIDWNDIFSWWTEKEENKGNHAGKDAVSGGAVTAKPEKEENKGNHAGKDAVSGGAVTAKPEKEENKGNHSDKDVVSGGAVTTTPEKNETNKTDKTNKKTTKKVKVKKTKKTAKNKIKVTLNGTNVWKNVKLTVKTSSGKKVKASIVKKTKTYCVIKTSKKLAKKTYVIKIKGVKVKGASKYETITTKVKVK